MNKMTPHMFPETLDGVEVKSRAEITLFNGFQQQLGNDFYVFHSVAWIGIRRNSDHPSDGEIDFIIAHPRMGILLLEVKGGLIGRDEHNCWYSIRRDRTTVGIKNPVGQVKDNKFALLRKLESLPNWQGPIPTLGHAVAFPDGVVDDSQIGYDMPPEIILFHENLTDLDGWVRRCMKFWAGEKFTPPGEHGISALRDLLRKSWFLREPRLGEEIGPEATVIKRYTEEQFQILEILTGRPRAAIRGCAGSGKTILAVEKARRLASEGFRTLLVCYNKNLVEDLKNSLGNLPRLKIRSFHGLCAEYAARTGRDQKPDWDDRRPDFFESIMPEALAVASDTGGDEYRFDAIVADEGQDFDESWWTALEMLLAEPSRSVFYVFFDDNQLVYPRKLCLPVDEIPFALTTNCRNTQKIHAAITRFYRSDLVLKARGPEGRDIDLITYGDSPLDLGAVLTEVLSKLVYAENVASNDIVILSEGGPAKPPLTGSRKPGVFNLVSTRTGIPNDIFTTTIRLFKGLESPVIILICPSTDIARLDELMYVGISRARNHLILLLDDQNRDSILPRLT